MECDEEQSKLQQRWQHLHLQERSESCTPHQRADLLRSLMVEVEYARAANILSHGGASCLWNQYADRYTSIVDSPEEQAGVNNFAEGALALLVGRRNESKLWTTSLTSDKLAGLDCVKKYLETSKVAMGTIMTPGKEDEVIHLKPRPEPSTDKRESKPMSSLPTVPNQKAVLKSAIQQQPVISQPTSRPLSVSQNIASGNQNPLFRTTNSTGRNSNFGSNPGNGSASGGFYGHGKSNTELMSDGVNGHGAGRGAFWNLGQGYKENNPWESAPTSRGQQVIHTAKPGASGGYGVFSNQGGATNKRMESSKRPFREMDQDDDEEESSVPGGGSFRTAKEQLAIENQKKYGRNRGGGNPAPSAYGTSKRSLGTRRGPTNKFVPPIISRQDSDDGGTLVRKAGANKGGHSGGEEIVDERLKNIDPKMVELVTNEIMDHGPPVSWDDIAGLEFAKKTIKEIVVWPMLRPDIFTGLRGPPKGLLLFGPPGTGKTLIGKCIASQSKSTFFSISASSLTSKWVGEGEKMVRALFAVARVHQPSVIFIDEIDSLLSQRSDGEHEASRRIKTEFLVQLDGATTGEEDRILVVGATNRPQEIDEAARRRFVKRLYIPLPEALARTQIVINLMHQQKHHLTEEEKQTICDKSEGYSGADMANLCREAALGPIRSMNFSDIEHITADQVRPILSEDFEEAFKQVRASVSDKDLDVYLDWNKMYGSWGQ